MRDRFRDMCTAAALATDTTVEVTFSGLARTMRNNGVLAERFRANMAAYGIEDQGDDPNAGSTDMANVSWVCPTIHPDLAIAPEGTPGHSILFRDAAATPRADETTLLAATLIAQTALDLYRDPALVAAAWAEFRATRLNSDSRSRSADDCYHPIGAPRWTTVRTGGAPQRDGPDRSASTPRPSPEDPPWLSAHTIPTLTPVTRAGTAGTRDFETFDDFDLPTYVGPATFMNLPWMTDPDEIRQAGVDVAIVGAPFDDAVTHRSGRPVRAAGDPRGAVHLRLDPLARSRRPAVRGPDRRRRRRRQHRPGVDRARPRDDLSQGPRGRPDRRDPDRPRRRPLDHLAVGHGRSPRSAGRAASASSTSTPTPTRPTMPGACWPATARRCAG